LIVAQKPNLLNGCTAAVMAEDYAGLIVEEFGGKVDLVGAAALASWPQRRRSSVRPRSRRITAG